MRNVLLAASLLAIFGFSCKLMKKKDDSDTAKKNGMTTGFTPLDWVHTTSIYEINVRQYTPEGTFNALQKELPRLKDMGVRTLWFMPITPIAQKNKKGSLGSYYACSDYTAINPEFGTLGDFKNLVRQAHTQGFKVIIDWVANHTGWDHHWTREHPEYYLKDSATGNFKIASGMDDIIELDYSNPALRKAMIDAMIYWINECDIDGFRCDLASWVEVDFWHEARPKVDAVKPLFWLGEFDELETPEYGKVFDASYSWKWMHKTREFYQNHLPITALTSLLEQYSAIQGPSMRAWFTTNHDENSWNGTEYEKYGNMAKALAVFSCTWDGVPLVYNGQELPMLTKRLEFFEKDPIPWTGTNELHDFYKTLLNLHATHPALRGGDTAVTTYRIKTSDDANAFAYLRRNGGREVLVVINLSYTPKLTLALEDERVTGTFRNVFSGSSQDFTGSRTLELAAWEYLVFEK
ncbi:MAG: alpha-amylase family glycosyl hydrolase [Chitinophagaceae bacterium]